MEERRSDTKRKGRGDKNSKHQDRSKEEETEERQEERENRGRNRKGKGGMMRTIKMKEERKTDVILA